MALPPPPRTHHWVGYTLLAVSMLIIASAAVYFIWLEEEEPPAYASAAYCLNVSAPEECAPSPTQEYYVALKSPDCNVALSGVCRAVQAQDPALCEGDDFNRFICARLAGADVDYCYMRNLSNSDEMYCIGVLDHWPEMCADSGAPEECALAESLAEHPALFEIFHRIAELNSPAACLGLPERYVEDCRAYVRLRGPAIAVVP